jgi:hypothetical protein
VSSTLQQHYNQVSLLGFSEHSHSSDISPSGSGDGGDNTIKITPGGSSNDHSGSNDNSGGSSGGGGSDQGGSSGGGGSDNRGS